MNNIVVGAGFSGATRANLIATELNEEVIDKNGKLGLFVNKLFRITQIDKTNKGE